MDYARIFVIVLYLIIIDQNRSLIRISSSLMLEKMREREIEG